MHRPAVRCLFHQLTKSRKIGAQMFPVVEQGTQQVCTVYAVRKSGPSNKGDQTKFLLYQEG